MTPLGAGSLTLALAVDALILHPRTPRPYPPPGGLSGRPYGGDGGVVNAAR
jgi:hypothetical protein